ncbi:hypothetical protein CPC08DRAFT_662407 [Agrocybe pediades]|nr:hypothetical protein CPC08DRAFT_662407 [Agrocybe pediades]
MSDKTDILVLGATGFTGGLITRYLSSHPQREHFTLAVGARSPQKLQKLIQEHSLPSSVKIVKVDVTKDDEIEAAVRGTRVVINTVGPYWTWGTPVVRACIRNGVHYVDLTGETAWIRKIIIEMDYFATKTGAIIVPACGFDSMPSDISAWLANKTLKSIPPALNDQYLNLGTSLTAHSFEGGISGGTIASFMTLLEQTPKSNRRESALPYVLSPFVGLRSPPLRLLYNLAVPGAKKLQGALFVMAPPNRAVVQRTFGLLEMEQKYAKDKLQARKSAYGPDFCYDEFMVTSSTLHAVTLVASIIIGFGMMMIKPVREIAKKFLPQSGSGPSEDVMQKGFIKSVNISTSDSFPATKVQTVIKGKGDPGYLLTSIMISEAALCFLLPPASKSSTLKPGSINDNTHTFTDLARRGGILTPMSAFGDQLIQRLEDTGRFEFSSSVVGDVKQKKVA